MVQHDDIREEFEEEYMRWARAVVKYCKTTQVTNTAIRGVVHDYTEDTDDGKLLAGSISFRKIPWGGGEGGAKADWRTFVTRFAKTQHFAHFHEIFYFCQFSSCHISSTVRATQKLLGTIQVPTFS